LDKRQTERGWKEPAKTLLGTTIHLPSVWRGNRLPLGR
jgi:hypothetical protein